MGELLTDTGQLLQNETPNVHTTTDAPVGQTDQGSNLGQRKTGRLGSVHSWSEPIFVLFVLLFLHQMRRFMDEGGMSALVLAAIMAAFACLARYVGITTILTGTILLIFRGHVRFATRISQTSVFAAIATLPITAWIIRNLAYTGTPTGPRTLSETPIWRTLGYTIGTMSEWFLPSVLGIVILAYLVRRRAGQPDAQRSARQGHRAVLVFTLVYLTLVVLSASLVEHDRLSHRLLAPIFPAVLLLLLVPLDREWKFLDRRESRAIRALPIIGMAFWLAWPIVDTITRIQTYREGGISGYSTKEWKESELIAHLASSRLEGRILSNAPDAIYLHAEQTASFLPYRDPERTLDPAAKGLGGFREALDSGSPLYIAWFAVVARPYLHNMDDLSTACELRLVRTFADGSLYVVGGGTAASDDR